MARNSSADKPGIVLIHPRTGFWEDFRSAPSLPLNLLHAASFVVDEFSVTLIDLRMRPQWEKDLREALDGSPVFIGISSMIGPATASTWRIARAAKRMSGAPVVLGGVHPTLIHESALREQVFDYVVCGEGELPLLRLARALASGHAQACIPGVRSRFSHAAPDPQEFTEKIDLDTCPEIPYHLVPARRHLQFYGGTPSFISMETSRGCPYKCAYCYHGRPEYSGWRAQSPDKVEERALYVKEKFNARGIYFVDDNFFIDVDRATRIAQIMARLQLKWQVQGVDIAALRNMDDDYLSFLASTGLSRISVGVDTGSDRIRQKLHKPLTAADVVETIARVRAFPIIVYCSFIVNFPGETASDLKRTVRLLVTLSDVNPNFRNSPVYQFVPFPGTQLAKELDSLGVPMPDRFLEWGKLSFENGYGADNSGLGRSFYKSLYFVSLFSDGKFEDFLTSPLLKFLSRLYSPLARFRLRKFFMIPVPEFKLFQIARSLVLILRGPR